MWIAALIAALGAIAIVVILTVHIAKSHELDPPAASVLQPLPAGASARATLRDCPITGRTCRLVVAVDQPDGDAVATVSRSLSGRGWPLVTARGGARSGCRTGGKLCAKVWAFADYADAFGLPSGLHVPIDAVDELRGHGAVVVVTRTE